MVKSSSESREKPVIEVYTLLLIISLLSLVSKIISSFSCFFVSLLYKRFKSKSEGIFLLSTNSAKCLNLSFNSLI